MAPPRKTPLQPNGKPVNRKAAKLPKFTQPRGAGRPTLYEGPAHCARARNLALLGMVDAEIADQFGINLDTLYEWKKRYPEFAEAIRDGGIPSDALVASAAFKRAVGYERPAVKIFLPAGADAKPVYAHYEEHYPGDPQSQRLWLFNRQPDRWRDKREVNVTGSLEHRIAQMTPEERRARLLELRAKAGQMIEGDATEVEDGEDGA